MMLMPSSCFSLLFGIILLFPLSFEFLGGAQSEEAELPLPRRRTEDWRRGRRRL